MAGLHCGSLESYSTPRQATIASALLLVDKRMLRHLCVHRSPCSDRQIVTVRQPVSFVYKLERVSSKGKIPPDHPDIRRSQSWPSAPGHQVQNYRGRSVVSLSLTYLIPLLEVTQAIHNLISSLKSPGSSRQGAFLHQTLSRKIADARVASSWMENYLACGAVDLGDFDRPSWIDEQVRSLARSRSSEPKELRDVAEALREVVQVRQWQFSVLTSRRSTALFN